MKRLYVLPLLISTLPLLSSCAPTLSGQRATPLSLPAAAPFQADFTDAGVTWVSDGKAYVARAPALKPMLSPLPVPASAAAWVGSVAWGALPAAGLVITLDGPTEQANVGRAWKLSHTRVYLQDGSAVSYSGGSLGGVNGPPAAVVTGGDGQDYALVGLKLYRSGNPPTLLSNALSATGQNYLYATPLGAASSNVPTLQTPLGLYRLTGSELQRLDSSGQVVSQVAHGPGLLGMVGGQVVTLSREGQLRRFDTGLRELRPYPESGKIGL